jgi:hypothetical protein
MRWLALSAALFVVVIGVALSYQSAAFSSRGGNDAPVYSVRRYDSYGTAALRDLLADRGIAVRTLERARLDSDDHGTLIQVLPLGASALGPMNYHTENQQLADWISQGNTVVQLTRAPTDLMRRFKIEPSTQPIYTDAGTVEDFEQRGDPPEESSAGSELATLNSPVGGRLSLWSPMNFSDKQDGGWKPIARLRRKKDGVVAGELEIGRGKLIVVGAPTPALNGMLADEGNLDFLLGIIGKGPVIIDEWSHGIGHEATIIGFIHEAGLFPVLLQLAFLAILYSWSSMGHHRSDNLMPARQRSSIEQVETLGFLYSRSLGEDVTFNRINSEVNRRLAEAFRCAPGEVNARLATLKPNLRGMADSIAQRLAQIRPEHGPRCLGCGYDLSMNETGQCPECGATIPIELRQRIRDAGSENLPGPKRARLRLDRAMADVLSLSYQLAQEVQRERRSVGRVEISK